MLPRSSKARMALRLAPRARSIPSSAASNTASIVVARMTESARSYKSSALSAMDLSVSQDDVGLRSASSGSS
jgi:hypothetical protein